MRAGLGLVYNLALEPGTRAHLKQEGLLTQLPSHLEAVCAACEQLRGVSPRTPQNEGLSLSGVAVEDLLECVLLGLLVLAKDDPEAVTWLIGLTPSAPGLDTPAELALRIVGIPVMRVIYYL